MPRQVAGPLTEADYTKINNALQSLENTRHEAQMALQAGLQCQPEDQLCHDLIDRLNKIKGVYFPMHP